MQTALVVNELGKGFRDELCAIVTDEEFQFWRADGAQCGHNHLGGDVGTRCKERQA